MVQLIPLIVMLAVVVFWLWMFKAMTENEYLPPCFITLTNGQNPLFDWTFAFVVLSIFTAAFYYATEYRKRP